MLKFKDWLKRGAHKDIEIKILAQNVLELEGWMCGCPYALWNLMHEKNMPGYFFHIWDFAMDKYTEDLRASLEV